MEVLVSKVIARLSTRELVYRYRSATRAVRYFGSTGAHAAIVDAAQLGLQHAYTELLERGVDAYRLWCLCLPELDNTYNEPKLFSDDEAEAMQQVRCPNGHVLFNEGFYTIDPAIHEVTFRAAEAVYTYRLGIDGGAVCTRAYNDGLILLEDGDSRYHCLECHAELTGPLRDFVREAELASEIDPGAYAQS